MRLVLLPGMDGTGRLFDDFVAELPSGTEHTIVRYPGDRVLGVRALCEILERSLPRNESYALVAESFSGLVAIEHAVSQPRRLAGIVLCASFATRPLAIRLPGAAWLSRSLHFRSAPPPWVVRWLLTGGDASSRVIEEVRMAIASVEPRVIADRLEEVMKRRPLAPLEGISVPVLYLQGARDRLVGERGLAQISEAIPHRCLQVIDGPHLLLQTRPRAAAGAILAFLSAIGPESIDSR